MSDNLLREGKMLIQHVQSGQLVFVTLEYEKEFGVIYPGIGPVYYPKPDWKLKEVCA